MSDTEQNTADPPAPAEPEQAVAESAPAEPTEPAAKEPEAEPAVDPAPAEPAAADTAEPAAKQPAADPPAEPKAEPAAAEPVAAGEAEPVSKPEEGAVAPAAEPAGAEAKDSEPKPKPAKKEKAKKEKPAPEPEVLPEKKETDLKIGFLQKYGASLFSKGWKHSLVALSDEGRTLNWWNFARDYQKKVAGALSMAHCDAVTTYEEDKTPKKPAAHGDAANTFVVRIHGKANYFSSETAEEAKGWIDILEENRQKHYVEKVVTAPAPKRASKKEKSADKAAAEGGATADPPKEGGATADPAPADPPKEDTPAEAPKENAAADEAPKDAAPAEAPKDDAAPAEAAKEDAPADPADGEVKA